MGYSLLMRTSDKKSIPEELNLKRGANCKSGITSLDMSHVEGLGKHLKEIGIKKNQEGNGWTMWKKGPRTSVFN